MFDPARPASPKAPSLLRAAGLIAVVTILSKVLGAVRDWQIMNVYGASLPSDAYFQAVQIPSFAIVLLGGLGGPFHTATVAVFAKLIGNEPSASPHARQLIGTFITVTALVFFVLSLALYWAAPEVMALILQGAAPSLVENATAQLRVMTPVFFFGGLIGIFYGVLNLYHAFFWPSLSPAALSIVMSVALLLNPQDPTGHVLAWSTVVGTVLQFALQLPAFFRRGFSLKPAWQIRAPEMAQLGEMLFPAVVGTTIGQLTTYVDMFFTATLPEGGWTAIVMGNRLIQLPIGVLQTALLVPIFPRFTRYVAEGDWGALKQNFKTGVVSLWAISLPMLVVMLFYTRPLIQMVFQHGSFDAHDTALVSDAVIFLAFSMVAYFARDSLTRVFYAFKDSKTPLMVGLLAIFLKALLDWLLVEPFGVGGITLSTTLITFINMGLLGVLSRRHVADLGFGEMLAPLAKLGAAATGMALGMMALRGVLAGIFPVSSSFTGSLLEIALVSAVGGVCYIGITLALKVPEVQYLRDRLLKRSN